MHVVITKPTWEEEFEQLEIADCFPPLPICGDMQRRVSFVLEKLNEFGLINGSYYDRNQFTRYRDIIYNHFKIDSTTTSVELAELLFAFANIVGPDTAFIAGCGQGVAIAFLASGMEVRAQSLPSYTPILFGVDIDIHAIERAEINLECLPLSNVKVKMICDDASIALKQVSSCVDFLFLDLDSRILDKNTNKIIGKQIYNDFIMLAYPSLRVGSIIIAHDTRWATIDGLIDGFLTFVRNSSRFSKSAEIRLDIQGVELCIK